MPRKIAQISRSSTHGTTLSDSEASPLGVRAVAGSNPAAPTNLEIRVLSDAPIALGSTNSSAAAVASRG
jgi:hypothetical protein